MLETEFKFGEVHDLASQVETGESRVHVKGIFSNSNGGVALLAMKTGQKLDRHTAPAELMVVVIEGEIEFTMIDTPHVIRSGQFMLVGQDVPHSVIARADSKIMLVKVKA